MHWKGSGYKCSHSAAVKAHSSTAACREQEGFCAYQHRRQAAEANGQHTRSIIMRGALFIAEKATKVGHLAQRKCVQAHDCQHDGIKVLRTAAQPKQKCECHNKGLQSRASCRDRRRRNSSLDNETRPSWAATVAYMSIAYGHPVLRLR